MKESFMKEKPVFPLIASMALPMVISMLVNSLYNIVDSFFVAQISEDAMTALSLVFPVQNFINAVAIGFGVGINAVIARYLGAGEAAKASTAATHGILLSAVHGILMTFICILIMPSFLKMFTSSQAVIDLGVQYSNIAFSFSLIIVLGLAFEKIFQSVGSMKTTMAALLCGCISNIALDPILIFGLGPFKPMGMRGAALATGIGQIVTPSIYLLVYFIHPINVKIGIKYIIKDVKTDIQLYTVGIPAILNLALPSILVSSLNTILAVYSQSYIVILGIYYKLQTFLYLPANGIIQGMRPVIGYNYGAGEFKRVDEIYRVTLFMNTAIMLTGTIICLLLPHLLIGLFTDNAETIGLGKTALRIICCGFIVSSFSVTSTGALEGLGKGISSFVISLFRYILIIIPTAFILSRLFNANGVWSCFWISETLTAAIAIIIWKKTVKNIKYNKIS